MLWCLRAGFVDLLLDVDVAERQRCSDAAAEDSQCCRSELNCMAETGRSCWTAQTECEKAYRLIDAEATHWLVGVLRDETAEYAV